MGFDYEDAWKELFGLFNDPDAKVTLSKEWIKNTMLDIEKNITKG